MISLPVLSPVRTEYGFERLTCGCEICVKNCQFMPAFLIPTDLNRLIPDSVDPFDWAEIHLRASQGPIGRHVDSGKIVNVRTLIPASIESGACHWLSPEGRCEVHAISPFGCAFFSCDQPNDEADRRALRGLNDVAKAHLNGGLYADLWQHLEEKGLTTISLIERRRRLWIETFPGRPVPEYLLDSRSLT